MIIKVGANGRIVIPKGIREILNIEEKDILKLNLENNKIIIEKVKI